MKSFFIDIFQYHHDTNLSLIKELDKHLNSISEDSYPLLSHNLLAHQIWNARILNLDSASIFETIEKEACMEVEEANFNTSMKILEELDLDKIISYSNSKGITYSNPIKEILFHVANHHTHHRGQIIANFRKAGIEPLKTDYIFYTR